MCIYSDSMYVASVSSSSKKTTAVVVALVGATKKNIVVRHTHLEKNKYKSHIVAMVRAQTELSTYYLICRVISTMDICR